MFVCSFACLPVCLLVCVAVVLSACLCAFVCFCLCLLVCLCGHRQTSKSQSHLYWDRGISLFLCVVVLLYAAQQTVYHYKMDRASGMREAIE